MTGPRVTTKALVYLLPTHILPNWDKPKSHPEPPCLHPPNGRSPMAGGLGWQGSPWAPSTAPGTWEGSARVLLFAAGTQDPGRGEMQGPAAGGWRLKLEKSLTLPRASLTHLTQVQSSQEGVEQVPSQELLAPMPPLHSLTSNLESQAPSLQKRPRKGRGGCNSSQH